jgi:hypothetical protein
MTFGLICTLVTNCVCVEVLRTCKSSVAGKKGCGRKRTSGSESVLEPIMRFATILVSTCSLCLITRLEHLAGACRHRNMFTFAFTVTLQCWRHAIRSLELQRALVSI